MGRTMRNTTTRALRTFLYLIIYLALLVSCRKEPVVITTPVIEILDTVERIETNKSRYNPGEEVRIQVLLKSTDFESVRVRYRHLTTVIQEETITPTGDQLDLSWSPPITDFRGYAIEFEFLRAGEVVAYASTAVDVSSDWTKFPRYGFLSKFPAMSSEAIAENIQRLNQYHINGLQFYDWHHKHHAPLPIVGNVPASIWLDIARRNTTFQTVQEYIATARQFNMAPMSYNLLYGAWEDFAADGVSREWMLFNDPSQNEINKHDLDDNWALSDIYLTNPANSDWQDYIFTQTDTIYQFLDFDGWHLDQLGHRGTVYDYDGQAIDLWVAFIPFLQNLKARFPEKRMVLNAVNQYGQREIVSTSVDFAYTEVWSPNEEYADLAHVILENHQFNNQLPSVLAAYVNYDLADQAGQFNEAAVLLADAVIMAFGGCHLELGEHMLGKEYFPNDNLVMTPNLERKLVEYYDFMVANQNVLRDGGNLVLSPGVTSDDLRLTNWPPSLESVACFQKSIEEVDAYHLVNFYGLNSLEWRDNQGTQSPPIVHEGFTITLPTDQVRKIVYTSPDWQDGVQRELAFTISGGNCMVEIPYLEYWGMLLVE